MNIANAMRVLSSFPEEHPDKIMCCYVNSTNDIQIIKINNIEIFSFERVVFPGQRLLFEALTDALLEIYTGSVVGAVIRDRIPCERLAVSS